MDYASPTPNMWSASSGEEILRIMSPAGSRMVITTEGFKGLFNLINISLSGAYGVIAKHNVKHQI